MMEASHPRTTMIDVSNIAARRTGQVPIHDLSVPVYHSGQIDPGPK